MKTEPSSDLKILNWISFGSVVGLDGIGNEGDGGGDVELNLKN